MRIRIQLAILTCLVSVLYLTPRLYANDLGNLSANPFAPNSTANPFGAGSPFSPTSPTNSFGVYGSPFSNRSAMNPYATDAPKLYDQQGNYRGKLSANPYDPDSTSNSYGRYGNPYSPDSLNNPYGAGTHLYPRVLIIRMAVDGGLKGKNDKKGVSHG